MNIKSFYDAVHKAWTRQKDWFSSSEESDPSLQFIAFPLWKSIEFHPTAAKETIKLSIWQVALKRKQWVSNLKKKNTKKTMIEINYLSAYLDESNSPLGYSDPHQLVDDSLW